MLVQPNTLNQSSILVCLRDLLCPSFYCRKRVKVILFREIEEMVLETTGKKALARRYPERGRKREAKTVERLTVNSLVQSNSR